MAKQKKYSVLLLYPMDQTDGKPETYYTHVTATSPEEATQKAIKEAIKVNGWEENAEGFEMLCVIGGHRQLLDWIDRERR